MTTPQQQEQIKAGTHRIGVRCTSCKDVIVSKHRHDFVACSCAAVFVDGGADYLRCGGYPGNMEMVVVCLETGDWEKADGE